jgi:hypothetical protein
MAGIDYDKLKKIITDEVKDEPVIKLENTFAMVRADDELQGINNVNEGLIGSHLQNFEFGSELRHRPDDAGVFEKTIVREDPFVALDQGLDAGSLFQPFRDIKPQLQEQNGIEFEGFGINFSIQEDEPVEEAKQRNAKKQERLRKDFERMILGQDANIDSLDVYKQMKAKSKPAPVSLTNCLIDPNSMLMEASTGLGSLLSLKGSSLVDRVNLKQDDEKIKREFL